MRTEMSEEYYRKAFADSLRELLLEKDFAKISANDIIKKCKYGKTTFYRVFKDKYAIIEYIATVEADAIYKEMDESNMISVITDAIYNNTPILETVIKDINNPKTLNIFHKIRKYYQSSVNRAIEYINSCRTTPLTEDEKLLLGLTISGLNMGRIWRNNEEDDRNHIRHALEVIFTTYTENK